MSAQLMPNEGEEIKAERRPYFPFYGDDWAGGTLAFTLEQEGFYLRFVRCQWARKADLPDDIKWLAAALHCDPRTVRRLRQFLIDAGKVQMAENGMLYNARMRREIAKKSPEDRAKIGRRSAGCLPKNPMISTRARARIFHFHFHFQNQRKKLHQLASSLTLAAVSWLASMVPLSRCSKTSFGG